MSTSLFYRTVAIFPALLLLMGEPTAFGEEVKPEAAEESPPAEAAKIPNEQLDSLVAPIALYPDPLLAQTLAASTYPIEIMQLGQWLDKNKELKDQALADAVAKQPWDPSVQAMAAFPEVAQRMAGNIQWTSDMGNAFLAQQTDVMDAVQRMRAKAESKGALKTGEQQKVEKKTVGGEQVIVVEQADPSTVYVPSYDPNVVYGEPAYPYPTYSYPGYVAGGALAFGGALALGAAWGDNWGWGCGWDQGEIDINVNNNYVSHYNKQNNIKAGEGKWQHNADHRGNAPYGDRGTADKFGGKAKGGAGGPGGVGGAGGVGKPGGPGGAGGAGKPGGAGGAKKPGGAGDAKKPGGAGDVKKPGGGDVKKPSGAGDAKKSGGGDNAKKSGGGDQIGSKNMGNKASPASRSGGGAISGGSGHQAKASSNRGGKSMGGGGTGGGGRKGGGGGGRR